MKKKLPNKEFRQLVPKLREKGFYKPKEERKINWPEYNLAQINEVNLLSLIRDLVNSCVQIKFRGAGKPLTNPKDLSKSVLFCELLGLPERQAQGYVGLMSPFLEINSKLDDRVIGNAYNRLEVLFILKQVFEQSKTSDGVLSGDGTGLETTRKQNYESNKSSGDYMISVVDSREIVQAFALNNQECRTMHSLIENIKGDSLRLDAGFVDRELTRKIAELGIKPFIFPKKNLNLNGSIYWKTMFLELYQETQEWLEEYHKRSHCESFHSAFKRKTKPLMKILPLSRLIQLTARIIIHNLRKRLYYEQIS